MDRARVVREAKASAFSIPLDSPIALPPCVGRSLPRGKPWLVLTDDDKSFVRGGR